MSDPIVRWTIGDVSAAGFEALRLSTWGASRLFGSRASYIVCVNSIDPALARELTGQVPPAVEWRAVTEADIPRFLRVRLDDQLAEGVGWKLAPLRLSAERPELALDNDCILWEMPAALRRWLAGARNARPVIAEDVRACFGRFAPWCGARPMNSGIRALPAHFDLTGRLTTVLGRVAETMSSELDEQGLQVAALSLCGPPDVVPVEEVSICSPFPPHLPHLGRCGAHFVGLNARSLPWAYEGRPATSCIQEHWRRTRLDVARRVGCSDTG